MTTILTICGALRVSELHDLKPSNVEFRGTEIDVTIKGTKTGLNRCVKIVSSSYLDAVGIVRRYDELARKAKKRDFYLVRVVNIKASSQNIGMNRLKCHTKEIAAFLQLPEPEKYTSHSGRRTAATFLANKGATNVQIKNIGEWTNMTTANGYIAHNDTMRRDTAAMVLPSGLGCVVWGEGPGIIYNPQNCTIDKTIKNNCKK